MRLLKKGNEGGGYRRRRKGGYKMKMREEFRGLGNVNGGIGFVKRE